MNNGDELALRLSFLEAAYDWEVPDKVWLARLIEAAGCAWGAPAFTWGLLYDASNASDFRYSNLLVNGPAGLAEELEESLTRLTPELVASRYRTVAGRFGRAIGIGPSIASPWLAGRDVFALNGSDSSGKGCCIGLGVSGAEPCAEKLIVFQGLSAHLASAYRCRRRLQELQFERLVERHDLGVLVARRSPGWAADLDALTDRELEVVTSAATTGKGAKEIAYDLAISPSTARVLLARACARLGVRTRKELLNLPAIKALRGHPTAA